ncbi:MAG: hypothetical protein QOE93_2475 [Actinomycetota bacterium]|nr:hypothetical protein [Actinomycetota bacterium]
MTPTADDAEAAAVFGRAAATYDTHIPFFASHGARLVEIAGLELGERVLDVGCGRGATLLPAAVAVGASGRVVGIDLAEEMVDLLGAELEAAGLVTTTVRVGNAQALDMEDASFDVVISQMVLHLLPDPPAAAAECFRVLVPGGRCVASAPTESPGSELLRDIYEKYGARATRPMAVPYRPDFDLSALLTGAGFEIGREEIVEMHFTFADVDAWWDWGWSNGIRALYEVIPPDDLESMREEASAAMAATATADGIPFVHRAHVVVAEKP